MKVPLDGGTPATLASGQGPQRCQQTGEGSPLAAGPAEDAVAPRSLRYHSVVPFTELEFDALTNDVRRLESQPTKRKRR